MKLQTDFLNLINLLWDFEQYNMWLPANHGSIAYLLDRLYNTEEYQPTYDHLYMLAQQKQENEFGMQTALKMFKLCQNDNRYTKEHLVELNKRLANQQHNYENGHVFGVAMIKERYMPDWFFAIFAEYINKEKEKMKNAIIEYCKSQEQQSDEEAKMTFEKLSSCFDILVEFYFYVKNNRFTTFFPISDGGITAQYAMEILEVKPSEAYLHLMNVRKMQRRDIFV